MPAKVRAVPEGHHTLTPHLITRNAANAIDFYKRAFGAEEINRHAGPGGKIMHAELRIGDSPLMLCDEFPEMGAKSPQALGGSPVVLCVYVENADKVFQQALSAGATETMPLRDQFWGDRYGKLRDPYGHEWSIATHIEDVSPEEMQKRAAKAMSAGGCGEK